MNLPSKCIEQIEKESNVYSKIPYDNVCFERGATVALTTPQIYEAAGLVKKEDVVGYTREQVEEAINKTIKIFIKGNKVNRNELIDSLGKFGKLIPLDEALAFAEWVDDSIYVLNSDNNLWQKAFNQFDDEEYYTTAQLFNKFKQKTHGK